MILFSSILVRKHFLNKFSSRSNFCQFFFKYITKRNYHNFSKQSVAKRRHVIASSDIILNRESPCSTFFFLSTQIRACLVSPFKSAANFKKWDAIFFLEATKNNSQCFLLRFTQQVSCMLLFELQKRDPEHTHEMMSPFCLHSLKFHFFISIDLIIHTHDLMFRDMHRNNQFHWIRYKKQKETW